ncbi:MAG: phosphonate C-P lyase system protein PhnL [Acidihalobacter sp.]|uniref:phosphonate C-P lyase system protein PhnL n=1 Tax=Acidihalobacter sp. TaxID=1872108 RepID=UPI00307F1E45
MELHDPQTVLEVRRLAKSFIAHLQGGVRLPVLADQSLDLRRGECLALAGASGSGKSTLLRCIYRNYLPEPGSSIRIRHGDGWCELADAEPRQVLDVRARTLGYVSQFLRVIPRVASVDLVAEPLEAAGMAADEARERAEALLARLQIPQRLWPLPPATFSGGEQQRVNIARGLVLPRPVLLLDEPTASLDADNRRIVIELIEEARDRGCAIIGIFHDAEARNALCAREHTVGTTREAA